MDLGFTGLGNMGAAIARRPGLLYLWRDHRRWPLWASGVCDEARPQRHQARPCRRRDIGAPLPIASLIRDHFLSGLAQGESARDWAALARTNARNAGLW